jgi:hypothetical protein
MEKMVVELPILWMYAESGKRDRPRLVAMFLW